MLIAGEDITDQKAAQERAAHGLSRRADRAWPTGPKLEEHLTLALARARRTSAAGGAVHRPRPLQAGQRHARPCRGRRAAARRSPRGCAAALRAATLLARQGGDEFMLLLADLDGDAAGRRAWSPASCWRTLEPPFEIEGHEFEIAASIGVARSPTTARRPTCSSAPTPRCTRQGRRPRDDPLRRPRRRTRDRPADADRAAAARARARRARAALPAGLRVATGRARSPSRRCCAGTIPSAGWSRPASSSRRRGQRADRADRRLGRRRRDRSGRRVARAGPAPGHRVQPLPRQLRSPGFADRLLGALRRACADPRQFIAEITESAAMADPERTVPLLERLTAAGPAAGDRRLRRRLLLARPPARPAGARAQDRPLVPARRPGRRRARPRSSPRSSSSRRRSSWSPSPRASRSADAARVPRRHGCTLAQGFHLARPIPPRRSRRCFGRRSRQVVDDQVAGHPR